MSSSVEELRSEALALSESERAGLIIDLLDSLDDRPVDDDHDELTRIWAEETARRAAQIDSGEATVHTWDNVLERVAETRRRR
jgi:putative addiction module component (TIGR02574 family)